MKTIIAGLLFTLLTFGLSQNKTQAAPAPPISVSFQVFYDGLSPYGSWVSYSSYGYAWVPRVSAGFFPYGTNGHWEYTDLGWMWVSDYAWGWAPFHYGRWVYDDFYGWLWVPGYNWSPAWVVWGGYGNYWGWAPMGFYTGWRAPANYWYCVPRNRLADRNVYNYRIQNTTVINNINIINNTRTYNNQQYNAGPDARQVQEATGKRIAPITVAESSKPVATKVENSRVSVYRPEISKALSEKAAPARVEKKENFEPADRKTARPAQPRNVAPVDKGRAQPIERVDPRVAPSKQQPVERKAQPTERVKPVERNLEPVQRIERVRPMENNPPVRETPPVKRQPREMPQQQRREAQPERMQPREVQPERVQPQRQPERIQRQEQPIREMPQQRQAPPVREAQPIQREAPPMREAQPIQRQAPPMQQAQPIQRGNQGGGHGRPK